ncbi:MAG: dihydroorotase [Oscillospiraceae bacterium]|nr:dihydroorotase [Oscillospiraceae bacterium]
MLNLLLKNGTVYYQGKMQKVDVLIQNGVVCKIDRDIQADGCPVIDSSKFNIIPGLADVHVHLREPGFSYKETILTGTKAAAKGGFTLVAAMPNLNPVPDSAEHLKIELDRIEKNRVIKVLPYGSITVGEKGKELRDMAGMAKDVIAFSDDGKGVQNSEMMEKAMTVAKELNKPIIAHCEVESLLNGGYIHDGEYAKLHGHKGISSASEYEEVIRDINLSEKTGCQFHACHISTKESVDAIRQAKAKGLKVSGETGPHYLAFTDMDLQESGSWKMNPPIRSEEDRQALIKGVQDGTIECIITDHAPHSREEKSKGLAGSSMGVVGLETSFAAVNTYMVEKGYISFEKLVEVMSINPRKIFGLESGIQIGKPADITIVDPKAKWVVNPEEFISMGKATPFAGKTLTGKVIATIYNGDFAYSEL